MSPSTTGAASAREMKVGTGCGGGSSEAAGGSIRGLYWALMAHLRSILALEAVRQRDSSDGHARSHALRDDRSLGQREIQGGMPMGLRLLRCFMPIAEELYFARAAERLHVDKSPLSRTIKELEEDLGAPLSARATRKHPIDAGRQAIARTRATRIRRTGSSPLPRARGRRRL